MLTSRMCARRGARLVFGAAAAMALALVSVGPGAAQNATSAAPNAAAEAAPTVAPPPPGPLTEEVIASVNDDVITNYDLSQRVRLIAVTAGIQPTRG